MKLRKKIVSLILCASIVMGLTACKEESGGSSNITPSITTSNTLDDDIRNPVNIEEFVDVEEADTLENPNLVYLGYYDFRVAGDIKPAVKLFEETYGGTIDYQQIPWAGRIEKLQTLISSGDSPDLVDKEDMTFPYMMSKNVYRDMTEYFEKYMDEPHWTEGYKELIERFAWNGKHYYYPWTVNALPNCLIYNADVFETLGIEDPKNLYDRGEWDWNSFKATMTEFMNKNSEAEGGVYGILSSEIFITTGVPLISIDDGKVTNNLNNANIDRAADFLMELRKEGFTKNLGIESDPLATSKMAFLGVGGWKLADFCKNNSDQTFGFVPYPRDPLADKYYYNTTTFSYMVPSGSPNPEGSAAFINIIRKCQVDPELQAVVNQSVMNDMQYSQEQFDFMKLFENIDNYDMVLEGYGGFGNELSDIISDMLTNIAFESEENASWTQLRTQQEGAIDAYLRDFTE